MYSNRWSTMPIHAYPGLRLPRPDRRASLAYMPGSDIPVIRQPFAAGDNVPFWANMSNFHGDHYFNRVDDPLEENNRASNDERETGRAALREALREIDAPLAQLERLDLL
jgi:hypothetical protein